MTALISRAVRRWYGPCRPEVAHPNRDRGRPRIVYLFSAPQSADRLYAGHFAYLREAGFEVVIACPPGDTAAKVAAREGVRVLNVPLERSVSIRSDWRAFFQLVRILRKETPDVLVYGTPKASFLGSIAGALTRAPVRVYVLHGLRLETLKGTSRWVMLRLERMIGRLSTEVWPVSKSLQDLAWKYRIFPAAKAVMIGSGSCNGVDLVRFNNSGGAAAKRKLLLDDGSFVFVFIGRITRDKGIRELVTAFQMLKRDSPHVRLLMVGRDDPTDPVSAGVADQISADPDIIECGDVPNPEDYLAAANALVLPTYREGLPTVLLEAAAAGCPIITTCATGARDVAADGRGLVVPVGDAPALAEAMRAVMASPAETMARRDKAQTWVRANFARISVWKNHETRFRVLLQSRGLDRDQK